jgi:hypothetical protein
MAEQLLDRILREIRERRAASRDAYEESQRLEAALIALGSPRESTSTSERPQRAERPRAGASSSTRAPRGENLRRIREAVADRPGASAGEIASATGIARPTVASTLGKLAREGEFERAELPGGRVGYRTAQSAAGADGAAEGDATVAASAAPDESPAPETVVEPAQPAASESPAPAARGRKPRTKKASTKRASSSGRTTAATATSPSAEPAPDTGGAGENRSDGEQSE